MTAPEQFVNQYDRDIAVACLVHHWEAGRLDDTQYIERCASINLAITTDELEAQLADLPYTTVTTDGPANFSTVRNDYPGFPLFIFGTWVAFAATITALVVGYDSWWLFLILMAILTGILKKRYLTLKAQPHKPPQPYRPDEVCWIGDPEGDD